LPQVNIPLLAELKYRLVETKAGVICG